MIVCHCRRVTHRQILQVVQTGARSLDDVSRACGAGSGCGGCLSAVCDLIAEGELLEEGDVAEAGQATCPGHAAASL